MTDRYTEAQQGGPAPLHVLLVEDHADSRYLTTRLLRKAGFTVTAVAGFAAALAAGKCGTFDILITDLQLPDGDGRTLFKLLSADHRMPAIMVTGTALDPDQPRRSARAGFCVHLTKPVDFAELIRAIHLCVARGGPRSRASAIA